MSTTPIASPNAARLTMERPQCNIAYEPADDGRTRKEDENEGSNDYSGDDVRGGLHRSLLRHVVSGCGASMRNEKGQALVELALTVVIAVFLVLGIIEFGYDFMALNVIAQATASGARAASVVQVGSRGLCG